MFAICGILKGDFIVQNWFQLICYTNQYVLHFKALESNVSLILECHPVPIINLDCVYI